MPRAVRKTTRRERRRHVPTRAGPSIEAEELNATRDLLDGCGACTPDCRLANQQQDRLDTSTPQYQQIHIASLVDQVKVAKRLYHPLHDWQTRLLELHSGPPGSELVATLHVADIVQRSGMGLPALDRRQSYEALSYCWGAPKKCRLLRCHGQPYPITENLYEALARLRLTTEPRWLWVDALSINQHDSREKSFQIGNMLKIYQKAQQVVVWLGSQGQHTEVAASTVSALTNENRSWLRDIWEPALRQTVSIDRLSTKLNIDPADMQHLSHGLDDLLCRQWYTRVWINQEVWSAELISVLCGPSTMTWSDLQDAAYLADVLSRLFKPVKEPSPKPEGHVDSLFGRRGRLVIPSKGDRGLRDLSDIPNKFLRAGPTFDLDLINVLRRVAGSSCSDPRDHIYGVLGMTRTEVLEKSSLCTQQLDPFGQPRLVVDYSRSVAQVFTDVAWYFIRRDQDLEILCLDATYRTHKEPLLCGTIPSWVPDWRNSGSWTPGTMSTFFEHARDSRHAFMEGVRPCIGSCTLLLRGFSLGKVPSTRLQTQYQRVNPQFPRSSGFFIEALDLNLPKWARRLPRNAHKLLGWTLPMYVAAGDLVVCSEDLSTAVVLRSRDGAAFDFIGPAYPCDKETWDLGDIDESLIGGRYMQQDLVRATSARPEAWEEYKLR